MKSKGLLFLLAAVLVSSSLPVANKLGLNQDLPILTFLAFRMSVAAIALWAILLCFRPKSVLLDRAGMIGCLQVSLLNCVSAFLYLWGLVYIDVSLSMLVFATAYAPIIMILVWTQGKVPTGIDILRFFIALIGIYLFVERSGSVSIIGIMLTVLNAFIYGLYNLAVEWRLSSYKTSNITLHILTQMAVIFVFVYIIAGAGSTSGGWPNLDGTVWGLVLWAGVVGTSAGRFFRFAGLKYAGNTEAALVAPLETIGSILLAVLLLNEQLTLMQWVGSFLVIFSVALSSMQPSVNKLIPFMRRMNILTTP